MYSPTGLHRPSTYARITPRFSGGAGREPPSAPSVDTANFGIASEHASPHASATPVVPQTKSNLSLWGTFKELFITLKNSRVELKDPVIRDTLKGVTYKYGLDALMSGASVIPGIGVFMDLLALPFGFIFNGINNCGDRLLKESSKQFKKDNKTHMGLKHLLKMDGAWNSDPKTGEFGKKDKNLSEYMATKYNKAIQGILFRSETLSHKLQVAFDSKEKNIRKQPRIFRTITQWTEARQALRQSPIAGRVFRFLSGLWLRRIPFLQRFWRFFLIIPRLTLQIGFFALKRKPHFG